MKKTQPNTHRKTKRPELNWFRELLLIGIFYAIYSWVRNQFGSAAVEPGTALRNARHMIDLERFVGLYIEADIQGWFLGWDQFLRFWNIFYGTLHFVVTLGALLYLYIRQPNAYPRWRTIGLTTTGLALIGFATYPLMPPRLLGNCGTYGACIESSPFVDTVAELGGLWSFDSGMMEKPFKPIRCYAKPPLRVGFLELPSFKTIYKAPNIQYGSRPLPRMHSFRYCCYCQPLLD